MSELRTYHARCGKPHLECSCQVEGYWQDGKYYSKHSMEAGLTGHLDWMRAILIDISREQAALRKLMEDNLSLQGKMYPFPAAENVKAGLSDFYGKDISDHPFPHDMYEET